jgi:4-hydroxymandelate oxidase
MNRRETLESLLLALAGFAASPSGTLARRQATRSGAPATKAAPAQGAAAAGPVNLMDFETLARRRISRMAYDYIAGGGADEITLRRNRTAFDAILLKPRVLVDVSRLDTRVELLGQAYGFPILLAPTAYHKLVHPRGELATVAGAAAAGATLVVSSFATVAIEDVSKGAKTRLWFQLYVQPDRSFTRDLVQRAEAAGCTALCITVDTPVAPIRDRETRSNFDLPAGMEMENLRALIQKADAAAGRYTRAYGAVLDPTLTWDFIPWVRAQTKLPVVLKGILAPEDARRAVAEGAHAVLVSNHGGRNLDTVPATIEALPAVVEAVEGRIPVLLDGGVRRGTDVVKALALGAKAVLIGRPYLWGLGVAGADGVERVVKMLRAELEAAMALCGVTRASEIDRRVLWKSGDK